MNESDRSKGEAGSGGAGRGAERDIPTTEGGVSRDDLFEMLGNRRRRYALRLLERDGRVELPELAREITAWEQGCDPETLSYGDCGSVRISLYQHHAPKLDDAGLVDYDDRERTLALAVDPETLDPFLQPEDDDDRPPWDVYFLTVTVLSTLGVGVGWAGGILLSGPAWAALVLAGFWAVGLMCIHDRYRQVGTEPLDVSPDVQA